MATVHNITTVEATAETRKLVKKLATTVAVQIAVTTVIWVAADQLSKAIIKKIES